MLAKHFKACVPQCNIDVAVRPTLDLRCQINKSEIIFQKIDSRFLNNDLLNRHNMPIASNIFLGPPGRSIVCVDQSRRTCWVQGRFNF